VINEVFTDGGAPIKSWAIDLEEGARAQMVNVSRLPFVMGAVALMPDAHQGYGMPVGGVFMADNAVVPYAIGVDIGCGVSLIETGVPADSLSPADIKRFLHQVSRDIPCGNGPHAQHQEQKDPITEWLDASERIRPFLEAAEVQLGTLGGGNHFLELQRGDDDGLLYFMIHSGSRSVGKKTCDLHHKRALALNRLWHSKLPHDEVAWLPFKSQEGHDYFSDMGIALTWAEENRRRMAKKVIEAFGSEVGIEARQTLDVHHNFAAWENHGGRNGIVHRKGAVRANEGEKVLIPGSMTTGSYIAEGLGNPEALDTCQHGAGRARSRAATRKMVTLAEMDEMLASANVQLVTRSRESVIDESAPAYKDIEGVMAVSGDLIRPIQRLSPMGVVKG